MVESILEKLRTTEFRSATVAAGENADIAYFIALDDVEREVKERIKELKDVNYEKLKPLGDSFPLAILDSKIEELCRLIGEEKP